MPELPDVIVHVECLAQRCVGQVLRRLQLLNPFVLRTALPPIASAEGRTLVGVERLGKHVVLALDGELFLVLHLMIAGRPRWLVPGAKSPGKIALARRRPRWMPAASTCWPASCRPLPSACGASTTR